MIRSYIDKWTDDYSLKKQLIQKYDAFIKQFDVHEQKVVEKIISKIDFYDLKKFSCLILQFLKRIKEKIGNNTCVCLAVKNDGKAHNSLSSFASAAKTVFKNNIFLMSYNHYTPVRVDNTDLFKMEYELSKYNDIVLIDDYCGSGDTMFEAISYIFKNINANAKIQVCSLFMLEGTKENLLIRCKEYNYDVNFDYYDLSIVRAGGIINHQNILDETEMHIFESINSCISFTAPKYRYGYNNSEEVISFQHFTPNNTLGFLWFLNENKIYFPLFSRGMIELDNNIFLNRNQILKISKIKSIKINITNAEAKIAFLLIRGFDNKQISLILKCNIDKIKKATRHLVNNDIIFYYNNRYYLSNKYFEYISEKPFEDYNEKYDDIRKKLLLAKPR